MQHQCDHLISEKAMLTEGSAGNDGVISQLQRYVRIRRQTEQLCSTLRPEDYMLQAIPEVSPPKWHLGHTTWFFEAYLLKEFQPDYRGVDSAFQELFSSCHREVNAPLPRERRGILSRPDVEQVLSYRRLVDDRVNDLMMTLPEPIRLPAIERLELGMQHELQHQEKLLTDIKYSFSVNPLLPAYESTPGPDPRQQVHPAKLFWWHYDGGVDSMGADPKQVFCFDNETPCHPVLLQPYALADRLITNQEYLAFIEDDGYRRPDLWLADGWTRVQMEGWQAPLYWRRHYGAWKVFTWYGLRPLILAEPVCHLSYYEADAYARWAGARLPSEAEWECAARQQLFAGHFIDDGILHPRLPAPEVRGPRQMYGDAWEWTSSPYVPYPGYRASPGEIYEYHDRFMSNQMVLRGGSCVSEREHLRSTYRNFLYPWERWQVAGIRLARSTPIENAPQAEVPLRQRPSASYEFFLSPNPRLEPEFHNLMELGEQDARTEILAGLTADAKYINPKYLYDERGCQLFELITTTTEYYLTRAEFQILTQFANDIAELAGTGQVLIEPGCGNCRKVEILLPALKPVMYLSADIAESTLRTAQQRLIRRFPEIRSLAVCVDFERLPRIARLLPSTRRLCFYPGSTLGNFEPQDAIAFLKVLRQLVRGDGGLLLGVDQGRDPNRVAAAYDDGAGITAAFNLNILENINRISGADFMTRNFEHRVRYDLDRQRIEMYLRSRCPQQVNMGGFEIAIQEGELIHTENAYKYDTGRLSALAGEAGFDLIKSWTDEEDLFALHYLQPS